MGTRSLTRVFDEYDHEIIRMYRQYDGYPSGHGLDLAEFLSGFVIVNGIGSNTPAKAANGMGCLAAQIVKHFKEDIGGIYLESPCVVDYDYGEEYEYIVKNSPEGLIVTLVDKYGDGFAYVGTIEDALISVYGTDQPETGEVRG